MLKFEQPIMTTEQAKEQKERKPFSLREHIMKITAILMPLGIAATILVGREYKKNQYLEAMQESMGPYSVLISETKKGDQWKSVERIWEDQSTGKRRLVTSSEDSYGQESRSYQDIITEEEKAANEQRRQEELENQRLAEEQQVQEQERQKAEIKEKAKEHLGEARELMYPYEYQEAEMQELVQEAQIVWENWGFEATPDNIKEFVNQSGADRTPTELVKLAKQIDETSVLKIAERIADKSLNNRAYPGWGEKESQQLENIIKYTLPKGWGNNIDAVNFDPPFRGVLGRVEHGSNKITMHIDLTDSGRFSNFFVHESIHTADARAREKSTNMPVGLQIKLAKEMQDFSKTHFTLGAPIIADNPEAIKRIKSSQDAEALAHTLDEHLTHPDDLQFWNTWGGYPELRQEISDFCKNFIKQMDPDFDIRKAADLRKKILEGWRVKEDSSGVVVLLPPEIQ